MFRTSLENGFRLLVDPTGPSAVAAAYLWIDVGSRDEPPGLEGAAHFLEHMLFKGTASYGVGEVAATVEALGGDINAWTSFDETVFHLSLPSAHIGEGIGVLAEMLRSARIDPQELERERLVILEEIRGCAEDPELVLGEATYAQVYGDHPYGRPIIGSVRSVRGIRPEALRAFYEQHYLPSNACLAVAGPVDLEPLVTQVRRLFGGGGPRPSRRRHPVQPRSGSKRLQRRFEGARLETVYPGPGHGHPDVPVLETVASALGGGASSPLESRLRLAEGLCLGATSHYEAEQDGGLFTLYLHPKEGKVQAALEAADAVVVDTLQRGFSRADLERAKAQLLADRAFSRETVDGRADSLAFHDRTQGDDEAWRRYDAAIAAVTPTQALAVARQYLRPEGASRISLVPPGESYHLRRPHLPPLRNPTVTTREPQMHTLPNGVRILLEPDEGEVVAVRMIGLGGSLFETSRRAGLVGSWCRSLMRGAGGLDALGFAAEVESLGGSIGTSAGRSSQGLRADLPSRDLVAGMELLGMLLHEPAFDPEEVEKAKAEHTEAIRESADRPDQMLADTLWALSCPGHPNALPPLGRQETVERFHPGHLQSLHRRWAQGENLVVAATGAFDPDSLLRRLRRLLERLPSNPGVFSPPVPVYPAQLRRRTLRVGREQALLAVSFAGVAVRDAEQPAVELLATILGGQGGRLFMELREKYGLAYAVSASSMEGVVPGLLVCSLGTDPDRLEEAEHRLRECLLRLAEAPIPAVEVERAKRYLAGGVVAEHQQAGARANAAAYAERYGLDGIRYRTLAHRVEQVTPEQLYRCCQRLRSPLAIVRVLPESDHA